MESRIGLNDSFPENAMAVTMVGDARKFMVFLFPSLRDRKFLVNHQTEVTLCKSKKKYLLKEVRMAAKSK